MSDELERIVRDYETPYLLEQFFVRRAEYGPEALAVMEKEIERRQPSAEELAPYGAEEPPPYGSEADDGADGGSGEGDSYVKLDDTFSRIDLLLVHAMLRDAGIAFYVDNPSSTVLPLQSEADTRLSIHVRAAAEPRAHELIDQHFHREDGRYRLKDTGPRDRLRGFSFFEVNLTETQLEEEVQVGLASEEAETIRALGRRLLGEAESIEKEQQRAIFYYDNIEETLRRLEAGSAFRVLDLLTVLEILQVYCDEPQLPESMLESAVAIIDLVEKM